MSEQEAKVLLDTVKNLTVANENLTAENKRLKQKLERMNELLLNAQRAQFGQSSEKRSYVLADSEQMRIFNCIDRRRSGSGRALNFPAQRLLTG